MLDYKAPTPAKAMPHPIPELLDGLERMVEVAKNPEQEALVGLCGFTGLRVTEALSATPQWFDLHNMRLTVRGKGDKSRVVPLSPRAWGAVSVAYVTAFNSGNKRIINYQDRSARKCVTNMGRRAELSREIASHDLRATFATVVYNKTKDMRVVQQLLGHANSATTEVYVGTDLKHMIEAVDF